MNHFTIRVPMAFKDPNSQYLFKDAELKHPVAPNELEHMFFRGYMIQDENTFYKPVLIGGTNDGERPYIGYIKADKNGSFTLTNVFGYEPENMLE